uniref:Uncharacterized protein n=1 Tax=Cacopsylla melanoneura TaxID=428564 RepID=A0A8D8SGN5_9HEMI
MFRETLSLVLKIKTHFCFTLKMLNLNDNKNVLFKTVYLNHPILQLKFLLLRIPLGMFFSLFIGEYLTIPVSSNQEKYHQTTKEALKNFRQHLKQCLIEMCPYSVQEFLNQADTLSF